MKRTRNSENIRGFALPTVMIASVVMLMVLLSGLVAASTVNTSLRSQYQNQVLRLAAEAGSAMTNACLSKNYNIATWTDLKPLKPNTDCSGNVIAGANAYVLETQTKPTGPITLRTTFEVPAVTVVNNTQRANVKATLLTYRTTSATASTQTSISKNTLVGGQTGFSNVTFGYCSSGCATDAGAQLAVVLATGEVKALGRNNNGRLGNASLTDSTTPSVFILPNNEKGVAAFSNFLSIGRQLSVMTASGKVYSAGANEFGQLGNTASGVNNPISTPVQFGTLGNTSQPKAKFVGLSNYASYVMADDNNIYSAGSCTNGLLGTGCASGNSAAMGRVALPAVNLSDTNTLPETTNDWTQATNMSVDRFNVFVRMKGGAVYGWGINDFGMLGDGTTTTSNTPKRIQGTTVMKAGVSPYNPTAKQIAFSGNTLYMVDTDGLVWATGENASYGEMGGAGALVRNNGNTAVCMDKNTGNTYFVSATCNPASGWQYMEWWPDGTWRFRSDSRTYTPTDAMLCATAPATLGTTSYIQFLTCTGGADQQWDFRNDKTIRSSYSGGCVEPNANTYVTTCNPAYAYQQWSLQNSPYLRPLPTPPGNPKALRVTTDNGGIIILYDNGKAYAAGSNIRGQLGTGVAGNTYEPTLSPVIVPNGRTIVDFYTTEIGPGSANTGVTDSSYNNSYFILDDGSVYGAGGNNFGQLGNGTTSDYVATPVKMNLPTGAIAKSVQSGYGTTVVLTTTGKIYTVGNNSNGQLGDGTTTSSSTPRANQYTNQRSTIIY